MMKQIHLLAFALIVFISCNGQAQIKPQEIVSQQKNIPDKQPKLTKTQGTDAYQNVHCGLQDKRGDLWFGTTGEGVYRYNGKAFTQFTVKDGLSNNKVWSVLEDMSGNIWFGTDDGISLYNGKTIAQIPIINNLRSAEKNNIDTKNAVWSMIQDKKGKIWLGTDHGVYCYDGKTFSRFLDAPALINKSGLTLKSVQCIFEDKNGNLWFGSGPMAFEGICLFDGRSLTNFRPKDEGWIRQITEDKNGTLLFDTRHIGVITYDGKTFSDFSKPQELRSDLLNNILVDSKGNIWYASDYVNDNDISTGGVWKFDGKWFVEFTKKDGLSNTSAYCIIEDRAGNIWLGTRNTGLYRYDGKMVTKFSE